MSFAGACHDWFARLIDHLGVMESVGIMRQQHESRRIARGSVESGQVRYPIYISLQFNRTEVIEQTKIHFQLFLQKPTPLLGGTSRRVICRKTPSYHGHHSATRILSGRCSKRCPDSVGSGSRPPRILIWSDWWSNLGSPIVESR